jgi:hypothetical protein
MRSIHRTSIFILLDGVGGPAEFHYRFLTPSVGGGEGGG